MLLGKSACCSEATGPSTCSHHRTAAGTRRWRGSRRICPSWPGASYGRRMRSASIGSGTQSPFRGWACFGKLTCPDVASLLAPFRTKLGTLWCVASRRLYGADLNRSTRVKPVICTSNRFEHGQGTHYPRKRRLCQEQRSQSLEFRFSRRYPSAPTLPRASTPCTHLAQGRKSCRAETLPIYTHTQGCHRAAAGTAAPHQTRSWEPDHRDRHCGR